MSNDDALVNKQYGIGEIWKKDEYISTGTKPNEFVNLGDRVELHYGSALGLLSYTGK